MIRIELTALIQKLHPICKQIFESTAGTCITRQGEEITVSDFLLQSLETPLCDIKTIFEKNNLDLDKIKSALTELVYTSNQPYPNEYPQFSPLLIDLLQDAWLISSTLLQQNQLRSGAILLALLHNPLRYVPAYVVEQLKPLSKEGLLTKFNEWTTHSAEKQSETLRQTGAINAPVAEGFLAQYTNDITAQAKENTLDPVLCRDKEINLMIDILCRRRKNNPIIVGEAGVGKSALIEGLALRIEAGQVPEQLLNTRIVSLDIGALQAGAAVKGELEKRFKGIINEIQSSIEPIIFFIDEAHTLIGSSLQGNGDIANLLKPALARGTLKTIAATTWSEYRKYFEKDAALSRRFQLVNVKEPNVEEATIILRGLRQIYEKSHQVLVEDDALKAAAQLSERYLSGRQLPDKAIDVLDTACARTSINLSSPPYQVSELKTEIHQYQEEIALLTRESIIGLGEGEERLQHLKQVLAKTEQELADLQEKWQKQQLLVQHIITLRTELLSTQESESTETADANHNSRDKALQTQFNEKKKQLQTAMIELDTLQKEAHLVSPHVDKSQIAAVIAEWTGVPLNRISQDSLKTITHLPKYIGKEIKGQELAIEFLHKHLLTSRADLRRQGRPLGAFLLVGPSGVGKTETVIQLSELLFGGRQYLTTINMSEFQEKHTLSRLIGSPPGYVGYGEGGVLTEAIRKKPYSVVLLDEVEKAHPDVLNLFYQAFDKGEIADGEGRVIDCKNVVFFLTSNLAYQTIVDYAETPNVITSRIYPELAEFFKPALLARMEVIPYLPLPKDVLIEITKGKLHKLEKTLVERFNAKVTIDSTVPEEIIARAIRTENGARMLESIIDGALLPPLSLQILNMLSIGKRIASIDITVNEGDFISTIIEKAEPTTKKTRTASRQKRNVVKAS